VRRIGKTALVQVWIQRWFQIRTVGAVTPGAILNEDILIKNFHAGRAFVELNEDTPPK